MPIDFCPRCRHRVVAMPDGACPACGGKTSAARGDEPARSDLPPKPSLPAAPAAEGAPTTVEFESFARMLRVIGDDASLRQWFSALATLPGVERRNAIYAMGERMRSEGHGEDLATCVLALADPRVFAAARAALD